MKTYKTAMTGGLLLLVGSIMILTPTRSRVKQWKCPVNRRRSTAGLLMYCMLAASFAVSGTAFAVQLGRLMTSKTAVHMAGARGKQHQPTYEYQQPQTIRCK